MEWDAMDPRTRGIFPVRDANYFPVTVQLNTHTPHPFPKAPLI